MVKVQNLTNDRGTTLANQFVIVANGKTYFQSYETPIAKKNEQRKGHPIHRLGLFSHN